jgi:threonylcarbamoyladenosine tRNA methylthiotransferase MtaB
MNFFVHTIGCKVNRCDSCEITYILQKNGFRKTNSDIADIFIINSCAVTAESVRKSRRAARFFKKNNPGSVVVLTGCAVQTYQIGIFEEIDIILGGSLKEYIPEKIFEFIKSGKKIYFINSYEKKNDFKKFYTKSVEENLFLRDRTRAFLKIEDGCENFCSYCIIPKARGFIRSKPLADIKSDLENLKQAGFKEAVLVGINLCAYGRDINLNLIDAVKTADFFGRIRLGSLEPDVIDADFIRKLSECQNLCPHFHLSLQSGSDKILKLMRRRYTIKQYENTCEKILRSFKNATFTTDLMVGFPGETERDFKESLKIISKIGFIKVNVFPFSARPGTLAANMREKIENSVKKERTKIAIEHAETVSLASKTKFSGKTFNVLFEKKEFSDIYNGYSENYIKIKFKSKENLTNKILRIKLKSEYL